MGAADVGAMVTTVGHAVGAAVGVALGCADGDEINIG